MVDLGSVGKREIRATTDGPRLGKRSSELFMLSSGVRLSPDGRQAHPVTRERGKVCPVSPPGHVAGRCEEALRDNESASPMGGLLRASG